MSPSFVPRLVSLRGRLFLLGGIVAASLLALAATLTWRAYESQRDALARDLQNTSRAIAAFVDQEFVGNEKLLRSLAGSVTLSRGDFAAFHERASAGLVLPERWITVVDLSGQQFANTRLPLGAPLPKTKITDAALAAWRQNQSYVSNLSQSAVSSEPLISMSVPRFDDRGELRHAVALAITPSSFIQGLDLPAIAPGYVITIIDRSGNIVARTPSGEKYIGQKATADIVAAAVAQRPHLGTSVTLEGLSVLAAVSPAPRSGWSVAIGGPVAHLQSSTQRLMRLSGLITLCTLLVTAAIIWSISRAVVHDVGALEADADELGAGRQATPRRWALIETASISRAMHRTATRLQTELRQRTEAEAALRVLEQRFRLAAASDEITLFEQDADLRYTWLHPEHPEHRHALGKTDVELAPDADTSLLIRLKREVLATGEPRRGEVSAELPVGTRHYSLFLSAKRDETGRVVGVAGAALDVTERKEAEHALTLAQRDLVRANAELETKVRERTASISELLQQMEEFTYSVSHDLRAPIRAMTSFSGVLLEDHADDLGPDGRAALERIVSNGQKMDRLINDLLAFSRVSRELVDLKPLSLRPALQEAVREVQSRFPAAVFALDGPLPDVMAQATLLSQVLVNLLSNAAKFVPPATPPLVRITVARMDGRVRLFIRDNGIGITPELQPRLFRVFERLHAERGYPGTGIGLAIVRRAMERMSGQVGVESDGVNGSCFWVEFHAPPAAPRPPHRSGGLEQTSAVSCV